MGEGLIAESSGESSSRQVDSGLEVEISGESKGPKGKVSASFLPLVFSRASESCLIFYFLVGMKTTSLSY